MKKLLTAFALTLLIASSVQAEDILSILERQKAVVQPSPPKIVPYNYTVDITMSEKEGGDEADNFTATLLVNPSLSGEDRVTILSTSHEDYGDEFKEMLEDMRDPETTSEEAAEEFWCEGGDDSVLGDEDIVFEDLVVVSETETEAVIKVDQKTMAKIMMDADDDEEMSKTERKMMKKMMERLDGEFVLSKPGAKLKHFKIWLTRPMSIAIIAELKEMEVTQSCATAPNGFNYTDSFTMRVKAKALGMGVEQTMDIRISELTLR